MYHHRNKVEKSIYSKDYRLFLELLRSLRAKQGLTQEDLGSKINKNQSFISKCERGERRLDIVELRAFCKAIGVNFGEFVSELEILLDRKSNNA